MATEAVTGLDFAIQQTPQAARSGMLKVQANGRTMTVVDTFGNAAPLSASLGWRRWWTDFARSRVASLDGPEYFAELTDEVDYTVAGNVTNTGLQGGVIGIGPFTGFNSVRPKAGSTSGIVDVARAYPWAIIGQGSPINGGATVSHAFAAGLFASSRFGWGYRGSVSTTTYTAWVEDNAGNVLNSVATTIPVALHSTPDQHFAAIFDCNIIELWYTGSDFTQLQFAGSMEAINNIPLTTMFPGCFTRTSGGGTETANYASILGIASVPR